MTSLNMTFVGAEVLTPAGWSEAPLSIADGVITSELQDRCIDLTGHRILPGIIDLHGDGFERHLAPRRGLMRDLADGLLTLDAELAACGITTAVLAQFWSWEGGMRGPAFARSLAEALRRIRPRLLTDMKLQLRFETHMLDDYAEVADFLRAEQIGYVVFNDHLPHKALAAGKRPARLTGQALKGGRSPEAHLAMMQQLAARAAQVPAALDSLASRLSQHGVVLGSHDDPSPETRQAFRQMGITVSEFPETMDTVTAAHAAGDPVILGAPNVVRGGSHTGNMSAADAIHAGHGDALVSDYHYPSLLGAVHRLSNGDKAHLARLWPLVSEGPARILRLSDRGALSPGNRADLLLLTSKDQPGATVVAGQVSMMRGAIARRFLASA